MSRQEMLFLPFEAPFLDGTSSLPSRDKLISQESIEGKPHRIPSIVRSTGKDEYNFSNLALPEGWQDVGESILNVNWDRQREIFKAICEQNYAEPGEIVVDDMTGLLKEVSVVVDKKYGGGYASAFLAQDGEYKALGMDNMRTVAPLMETVASFLNKIKHLQKDERSIATIFTNGRGYGSDGLFIPDTCLDSKGLVTTSGYQEEFKARAKKIGTQLGEEVKWTDFNSKGILSEISLSWGSACSYSFREESLGRNAYTPHNVDGPRQAIVLHSVAAAFVNDMLDVGHAYAPLGIYD